MPPATQTLDPDAPARPRFKMRLLQSEYMIDVSGNSGRFPAGAVLIADEETAYRWYERGIAEPADPDAETYGEVAKRNKREEFKRRAKALETGVFDQAVRRAPVQHDGSSGLMPPPMPTPRSRRERERALAGAEIVNSVADEDEA